MRIGTPPSSVNCLVAAGFLLLPRESETIRVPKHAAGTITTTFIAGCKYTRGRASVQIGSPNVRLLPGTVFTLSTFCSKLGTLFPSGTMLRRPREAKAHSFSKLHGTTRVNTMAVNLH